MRNTQASNRITQDKQEKNQRKFVNEERKKHTKKNLLKPPHLQKSTMYSDYVSKGSPSLKVNGSTRGLNPLQQMKKLVRDAADFDKAMAEKETAASPPAVKIVKPVSIRRPRFTVDKRLLQNHLKVAIYNVIFSVVARSLSFNQILISRFRQQICI